ncbi:MAG: 1,4-alpha-glucan branching protein GlgB [Bacillales bacterium]|nr:1,4-alpha-glucan branching protein GlgB [Bacillales bacterium]
MAFGLVYDFLYGQTIEAYKYFGCHHTKVDDVEGCVFRVYAPQARSIHLIGEFNSWNLTSLPMNKIDIAGVYELFVPNLKDYQTYKYRIETKDGYFVEKADPFGFLSEYKNGSSSRIFNIEDFIWHDEKYLSSRDRNFDKPMSIYEIHLGSWLGPQDGRYLSYEEIADKLIDYVIQNGFTHVEIMPITQYPFDGSWGYQATGFFSVDSRYGNPKQLMSFVDRLHQAGIGVILDFVLVHFATDNYGLCKFDGTNLFEGNGENEKSQWGSYLFDLGKDPVRSYLMSSVNYFLSYYHFDGIRFDAISNVIYYHGDSSKGVNEGAVELVKRMNSKIHQMHPDVMLIAEDSSSYAGVTKPLEYGGLGFDYKWDLGWMNDTLKYYGKDPIYRKYHHNNITFSMAYFYSDNFLLPFSHDEVVHGKGTIINKMWGNYEQKFAQIRNLYTYQWAHPGKKLNFMGNELASFDEWNETKSLPWVLKKFPSHDSISRLIRDLNLIYIHEKAMYFEEYNPAHYQWLMVDNANQSIFSFKRTVGDETLVFVFNMTPAFYSSYNIGVTEEGEYEEIFNSDKDVYGSNNQYNGLPITASEGCCFNQKYHITIKLASFGAMIFKHVKKNNIVKDNVVTNEGKTIKKVNKKKKSV